MQVETFAVKLRGSTVISGAVQRPRWDEDEDYGFCESTSSMGWYLYEGRGMRWEKQETEAVDPFTCPLAASHLALTHTTRSHFETSESVFAPGMFDLPARDSVSITSFAAAVLLLTTIVVQKLWSSRRRRRIAKHEERVLVIGGSR